MQETDVNKIIDYCVVEKAKKLALKTLKKRYNYLSSEDLLSIIGGNSLVYNSKLNSFETIKNQYNEYLDIYSQQIHNEIYLKIEKVITSIIIKDLLL